MKKRYLNGDNYGKIPAMRHSGPGAASGTPRGCFPACPVHASLSLCPYPRFRQPRSNDFSRGSAAVVCGFSPLLATQKGPAGGMSILAVAAAHGHEGQILTTEERMRA